MPSSRMQTTYQAGAAAMRPSTKGAYGSANVTAAIVPINCGMTMPE